jgi:hypothetical protein
MRAAGGRGVGAASGRRQRWHTFYGQLRFSDGFFLSQLLNANKYIKHM